MRSDALYFALNETTHALRFVESAATRFAADPDELESGSVEAASVAYIKNRLSDAQDSLTTAKFEIGRLIEQGRAK